MSLLCRIFDRLQISTNAAPGRMSLGVSISLLLLALVALNGPVAAADKATVMVVFDGSGSMWGKLDGERKHKLSIARDAVGAAFEETAADGNRLSVGLMSFGHRRSRDCTDAGALHPIAPFDAGALMEPLNGLNPRGRGPLTRALREGADRLDGTNGAASIILLHDGIDNCREDPCEFAREFAKKMPRSPVHVISIGLARSDFTAMSCIAKTTGGRHFDAQDSDALTAAMATAWNLAIKQRRAPSGNASGPDNAKPPADLASAAGPGETDPGFGGSGLFVTAALGPGARSLTDSVRWRVFNAGNSAASPMHETTAATLSIALPPGQYVVEAEYGTVQARKNFTVPAAKPLRGKILFNAGTLAVNDRAARTPRDAGGTPQDDIAIAIVPLPRSNSKPTGKPGQAAFSSNAPIIVTDRSRMPMVLPAGRYTVRARRGMTSALRAIDLAAGSTVSAKLLLNSGTLRLRAKAAGRSASLDNVLFVISESAPDAPDGRREIARSIGPDALFVLRAGTYLVLAKNGLARTTASVAIQPGSRVEKDITIASADLQLSTALGTAKVPAEQPIVYKITALDNATAPTFRTSRSSPKVTIAPGRYRIESRVGYANAVLAYEISMRLGQNGLLKMKHQAGLVRLKLTTEAGGLALGQVFWNIIDDKGSAIRQSNRPEPQEILAAGSYVAIASQRGRIFQQGFNVAAGSSQTIELLIK